MKVKGFRIIAILILVFTCTSCTESIEEYYYSLEGFTEPKIFKYECKSDPNLTQYWKMSSDQEEKILITEAYNSEFVQFEYFSEKFDSKGSKLVEYSPISGGIKTITTAIDKDVILWESKEQCQYKVEYKGGNGKTTFTKKRKFLGFEEIDYMGSKTHAVKLRGDYSFYFHDYNETVEYWQDSYYAKEHGFVKYNRTNAKGENLTLELTAVLSEPEWNKIKN